MRNNFFYMGLGGVQIRHCTPLSDERGVHLHPCTPPLATGLASIVFLAGLVCQGIFCSLRPNFKSFPRNVELYLLNFMLKHGLVKKTITRDSSILELKFPDAKFIQQAKNFSQTQDKTRLLLIVQVIVIRWDMLTMWINTNDTTEGQGWGWIQLEDKDDDRYS